MVESIIDLWVEVCPGGWSLKISIQPSAFSNQPKERAPRGAPGFARPGIFSLATLCLLGIGFGIGPPKRHARATQAPPKRGPRVAHGLFAKNSFVCNKSVESAGWGRREPRVESCKSLFLCRILRLRSGQALRCSS